MRSLLTTSVAATLLLGAAAPGPASAGEPPYLGVIEVGQPFPGLWLPEADDGRPMSVSQLRGSRLVLHVFASW
jgi:hypothetical protein